MNDSDLFPSWKVIVIVMLFVLGMPFFVFASANSELSETEVVSILCSEKWHLSFMEMDGQHLDFPPSESQANWTKFSADGTHQVEEMGEAYSGTWVYNHTEQTLTTTDRDGIVVLKIIQINDAELKFSLVDQGKTMTVGMKKE